MLVASKDVEAVVITNNQTVSTYFLVQTRNDAKQSLNKEL